MEKSHENHLAKENSPQLLTSLIKAISANEVADFDSVKDHHNLNSLLKFSAFDIETPAMERESDNSKPQRTHSVSISMPPSPIEAHIQKTESVLFTDDESILGNDNNRHGGPYETKNTRFYSQPMPEGTAKLNEIAIGTSSHLPIRTHKLQDNRFDSFKTWSGKLERQISNLRGKHRETEQQYTQTQQQPAEVENLPVDRYFDALEGPELDTLRASEEILLPEDKKWPFLLRFPISSFGICLGVGSQAIMWKTLSSSPTTQYLHITPHINLILWLTSLALLSIVAVAYALKIMLYFEAVRREYYHPIRANFFFAPWISLLFLALGVPPSIAKTLNPFLWYILMAPICCLEIKIYGQWMSGGQRRLSKVANPSNHLSVVGNFVGALLGASMGLKEGPIFFFAVGLAHYTVLFVTLYQRLPTNETLPKELHPVFFLFVAAPSVASMAWARIQGSFDYGSRIAFFIALFLYFSLAVRVKFFTGFRFSLAWWAYTFPMTGAAIAAIKYSDVVTTTVTKTLTAILCIVATLTVAALLVTTIIHAFVLNDLFPNDIAIAIAISERKPKTTRRWYHRRSGSSDTSKDQYLKFSDLGAKDIEVSVNHPSLNGHQDFSTSVENDDLNKVAEP